MRAMLALVADRGSDLRKWYFFPLGSAAIEPMASDICGVGAHVNGSPQFTAPLACFGTDLDRVVYCLADTQ